MQFHPTPNTYEPEGSAIVARQCALCSAERMTGGYLSSRSTRDSSTLWVCDDCQNKLARRLDDEGTLGG